MPPARRWKSNPTKFQKKHQYGEGLINMMSPSFISGTGISKQLPGV
jgi:hypothetical protein